MVCDLASINGASALDEISRDTLVSLCIRNASYLGIKKATATTPTAATIAADFLVQLSAFKNFKLLGETLGVNFTKRITLIFGANGSGKSSLCEALKVLATQDLPIRPLQNVRAAGTSAASFRYRFRSDNSEQSWTPATGYGPRRTTVKYFDTAIAIRNVKSPVQPGRIVVLEPFKLQIFEHAKTLTTKFREELQKILSESNELLNLAIATIKTDFERFKTYPLASLDEATIAILSTEIKLGELFSGQQLLQDKQAIYSELTKASSEEGLKLLRAEYNEWDSFLTSLKDILVSAEALWALEPEKKSISLRTKQTEQEILAKALIPKNGTLENLLSLIRDAALLCKLDDSLGHPCPLCSRTLEAPESALFKCYHELLVGELEKDIEILKRDLSTADGFITAATTIDRTAWDKATTIEKQVITTAKTNIDLVVSNCLISQAPLQEAREALKTITNLVATWSTQLDAKKAAIEAAEKGRDVVMLRLQRLHLEIVPLEYEQLIANKLESLKKAENFARTKAFWTTELRAFTHILRRITEKTKEAYEHLVVGDFEKRLEAEYRILTEKNMAAFGVTLSRKGADAAVTVSPQIGGRDIEGILSEGEQRIHALALFFAELETCTHSVLVFDDPISSFDYNYVANYCSRLRDLALKYGDRQIIVLTHNWEFFVQLQVSLNSANLNNALSVQVLENCSNVADYSENVDDLKISITTILSLPTEPNKSQKEEMAGKMRRLIESVINTHVFNHQRHQYKQKSQAITAFHSFTKLVPLLPNEATTLRDLYAKLSITEHDDPRNAYVSTDKATFQSRYDQIASIETSIKARIP